MAEVTGELMAERGMSTQQIRCNLRLRAPNLFQRWMEQVELKTQSSPDAVAAFSPESKHLARYKRVKSSRLRKDIVG